MPRRVWLGLGSNMGDRLKWLRFAVSFLAGHPGITIGKISSVYETSPWGVEGQENYYNAVVEISTELGPYELLQLTQKAEELSGRERKYHWAPRRLDIDILLIEGLVLDDPRLTVPHPLMKQRLFVLQPLAEIAGCMTLPDGEKLSDILCGIGGEQKVKLLIKGSEWMRGNEQMKTVSSVKEMGELARSWHKEGKTVGLVPTMGYLHQGHLSLIEAARNNNDIVVVSIFVNPTQFGPNEDYERYPRDLAADSLACEQAGVDVIFAPEPREMYPEHFITYVEPTQLETRLCGVTRPIHFRGVCTVVLKLFNIVQPDNAYFGQKDAQQFFILERMVRDLNLDDKLTLHRMPIIREEDGLARSSRNVYLSQEERQQALCLSRAVAAAERCYAAGQRDSQSIISLMEKEISSSPLARIDYLTLVDTVDLLPVSRIEGPVLVAMAVYFGNTRLIDNTILGEK